jgi:hypothetical protein
MLEPVPTITKFGVMIMTSSTKVTSSNDRNGWAWGFTPQAESWNGRFAMIGFAAALVIELLSGQGVLHFWNLL